jgi:hypothetical protein
MNCSTHDVCLSLSSLIQKRAKEASRSVCNVTVTLKKVLIILHSSYSALFMHSEGFNSAMNEPKKLKEPYDMVDSYPTDLEAYRKIPCSTYFDMIARCGCMSHLFLFTVLSAHVIFIAIPGMFKSLYRYGNMNACSSLANEFRFCLSLKMSQDPEVQPLNLQFFEICITLLVIFQRETR